MVTAHEGSDWRARRLYALIALCCAGALVAAGCGGRTDDSSTDTDGAPGSGGSGSGGSGSGSSGSGATSSSGGSGGSSGGSSSGSLLGDASTAFDGSIGAADGSTGATDAAALPDAPFVLDASVDVVPPPTGQAGFAFVINGVVQTPIACPAYNWEFPSPAAFGGQDACGIQPKPPCPGITRALIVNTGQVPIAYTAETTWNVGVGSAYPPGVQFGDPNELSGVLNPGDGVDITSVFVGAIVADLGASEPFSDGSHYVSDEGTIAWPAGVAGSGGATEMHVAEINIVTACRMPTIVW